MGLTGLWCTTIHVDVTPEQAFDFFTDAERIAEWHVPAGIEAQIPLDAVGAGYTVRSDFAGRTLETRWTIIAYERPRLLEMRSTGSMNTTRAARFAPVAGGTDVTLECEYELPLAAIGHAADGLFLEGMVGGTTERSLRNFKALVEAEPPVRR
jgi:uncharacterized protein YndB with AHSA1/START domain